ncbi:YdaS family helix-turn-helix protein [Escherichia coli]|uniref:YdaS family helix-turn-helix protein n=1 Tax=Escherichia coli TaxID=562 RepID=UPI00203EDCBC|nr:YdaS family helix-turn-helix protein [Escherichia coli]
MKAYWDSLTKEQQGELAGKVGSTPGYLRLVFNGYKKASFVLAKKLEQCTSGAITKSDLRPDITRWRSWGSLNNANDTVVPRLTTSKNSGR